MLQSMSVGENNNKNMLSEKDLVQSIKEWLKKDIEAVVTKEYDRAIAEATERLERQKAEAIAAIVIKTMEYVQVDMARNILTIRVENIK